jgi:hypothetical protein
MEEQKNNKIDVKEMVVFARDNGDMLKGAVAFLIISNIMFFSGASFLGLTIVSWSEGRFFANAHEVNATVVEVVESVHRTNTTDTDGTSQTNVQYDQIVKVSFLLPEGSVHIAKQSDGTSTLLAPGDEIVIFYDPEYPSDIRFAKDLKHISFMQTLAKGALGVFGVSVFAAALLLRRKKNPIMSIF